MPVSKTMDAITLGTFRLLLDTRALGDTLALRRISEKHSHEARSYAQWMMLLERARPSKGGSP